MKKIRYVKCFKCGSEKPRHEMLAAAVVIEPTIFVCKTGCRNP